MERGDDVCVCACVYVLGENGYVQYITYLLFIATIYTFYNIIISYTLLTIAHAITLTLTLTDSSTIRCP
jgi:hypothetical protein